MVGNEQDALARAFAMLSALRKNISEMASYNVPEKYVHEFHTVLNKLEEIVQDIAEFRIPDSEVTPIDISTPVVFSLDSGSRITPPHYSKEKYVDKSYILTKLDVILGYFEIITSEKPRRIGFTK
ncbi:hypothetical protein ACFLUK_02190 [Chloroflexota bacterium]